MSTVRYNRPRLDYMDSPGGRNRSSGMFQVSSPSQDRQNNNIIGVNELDQLLNDQIWDSFHLPLTEMCLTTLAASVQQSDNTQREVLSLSNQLMQQNNRLIGLMEAQLRPVPPAPPSSALSNPDLPDWLRLLEDDWLEALWWLNLMCHCGSES